MVRLTTFSNILSGIGLTVLAFSVILKYLLQSLDPNNPASLYAWIVGAGLLIVVLVLSVINTFTELGGFVHPEDKLVSNMFVFLMAIATILIFGLIPGAADATLQRTLFDMGTMIVIAYVFLFVFVFFSARITEAGEMGQVKEMTARFMLISLVLGAVMAGIKFGTDAIWASSPSYEWAAGLLGAFATTLVVLIVIFLGRRYEPVGE